MTRIQPLRSKWTFIAAALLLLIPILFPSFRSNSFTPTSAPVPSEAIANLPNTGVQISRILTDNPFTYAFFAHDEDSYQVKDENIRALEPGLSALWVQKLKKCCANGGTVLDIGSHFGYYALLGHSMGCEFIAFEPIPIFRRILQFNLFLNNAQGKVYPYALGTEKGKLSMMVPKHGVLGTAHGITEDEKEERAKDTNFEIVTVEQHRLDELVKLDQISDVCMMKIDVEGFEPLITNSADKMIKSGKIPYIMMEFSPGFRSEGLLEMLELFHKVGYTAIEVPWHLAKAGTAIPDIAANEILRDEHIVDISTKESRQALIDRILPVFNTNLWLYLPQ